MTAVSKPEPTKNPRGYAAGIFLSKACREEAINKSGCKRFNSSTYQTLLGSIVNNDTGNLPSMVFVSEYHKT